MKFKMDKALTLVAAGVIGVLQSAQAAPVYQISNLDLESYDLNGKLAHTRNSYGLAVNNNDEVLGISVGRKKLTIAPDEDSDEEDGGSISDVDDGIAASILTPITINNAIVANNFPFMSVGNAWLPSFESVNGSEAPIGPEDSAEPTAIDSYFYGINDSGVKVGVMSAPELTEDYTFVTEPEEDADEDDTEESTPQEFWFYRDYEQRAFVKDGDTAAVALTPPYTTYVREDEEEDETTADDIDTVEVGGMSAAAAINNMNQVAGYAGVALSESSKTSLNACLDTQNDDELDETTRVPLNICVQSLQFAGSITYQTRGYVWQYEAGVENPVGVELPLGLTPDEDDSLTYTSQAFAINNNGVAAGRSPVMRNGDENKRASDAAYWTPNEDGSYQYNWVKVDNVSDVLSSTAYGINDAGMLVGNYQKYIKGQIRSKFFYFDTNNPDAGITAPQDFYSADSDLSSRPKAINNNGDVVGDIEVSHSSTTRPKEAFLYNIDADEFNNLNDLLTCESRGFEQTVNADGDAQFTRHKVTVEDGTGETLTYESEIKLVEANSINDNGTIVGTAYIRKPVYQYDTDGHIAIGDNGKPLFERNGYGEVLTSFTPRQVVLERTSSESACSVVEESENHVRQGGASFAWILMLPLLWFRRRH